MTSFGSAMTAGYTAGGLRAWKQNASGRTYQLYAGGVIPVCQLDSSGNVISANTVADTGLLATRTSASAFYAFDVQGSASHRLDGSGSALSASVFDAFGVRVTNDTSGDPFAGFGGQFGYRTDSETGLQLLGYRLYDPTVGRFVNRDPIGYNGGVGQYSYCANNSVTRADTLGLWIDVGGTKQQKQWYNDAINYLKKCKPFRDVYDKLKKSKRCWHIKFNDKDDDSTDPSGTVNWDPRSGLQTSEGGQQTPALGLGHEFGHAWGIETGKFEDGDDILYPNFGYNDDRRVINGLENECAKILGEPGRRDHGGETYRTKGPITTLQ